MPPVAKDFQWHPKSWPGVNSSASSSFQSHTKQSNVRPKRTFTVQNNNSIYTKESTFSSGQRFSHRLNPCPLFFIYSISGMWLQKFAQALSVELQPKNTWSTGTLNTTPAKSPAPRWTFKQALCQKLRSQTLDWASCLEKWYLFQERCFPTPLLTWWQSWAATLVLLLVSPLCTSSSQSTWFGNKLRTGGSRVWIACVQLMIIDTNDKLDLKIRARDWNKVALTLSKEKTI